MTTRFTWIPLYRDLAARLLAWEHRQPELIAMLAHLREQGVKVTSMSDRDDSGARFLLKEIDPFTFFGTFNRNIRSQERLAILTSAKELLGSPEPLPADFDGLPTLNNQRSWFFSYQNQRGPDDVSRLWRVFRLAQTDNPLADPEFAEAFDRAVEVRCTNINLTMGLFWIRPDRFLNLDSTNRAFLKIAMPAQGLTAEFYVRTIHSIEASGRSLTDISADAWQARHQSDQPVNPATPPIAGEIDYWLVGAYWEDRVPPDQTDRLVEEGIWENGYEDRYLDQVKSVKVGDRIAIKSSSTQKTGLPFDAQGKTVSRMTIKAVGTVVANRGDGRTLEVEWDTDYRPQDWYFFTGRATVWRLRNDLDHTNRAYAQKLIEFIWGGVPQDYDWFRQRWWGVGAADVGENRQKSEPPTPSPFGIEDIIASGVFLPESRLQQMVDQLRMKKNLILQGAPGVGKTFVARMLAYALMEEKATERVQFVQFHQTYSYEDFVRGYRPSAERPGTFELKDAVFYKFCKKAQADPEQEYVFVIDEINRGNLSQIFGYLLMLIESDQRGPHHAIELVYQRPDEPPFAIPANLYILGLMNLADRSIAVVDYALRRRFAFVTLTPRFDSEEYRLWLSQRGMTPGLVSLITGRLNRLNEDIRTDPLLGENFQIGHSFFCPKGDDFSRLERKWYDTIVETEVAPLLKEYWFDNSAKAEDAKRQLLAP